jgi:site-specific recombinase XerD
MALFYLVIQNKIHLRLMTSCMATPLRDCRIHTLRHTHASRLVQNGMSVYEVKEILGHTDIKTTLRYAHLEQRQVTSKARDVINRLNQNSAEIA